MFDTILFPIDRSRETQEAAETVTNLVNTYNSRLILLSVVEMEQAEDEEQQDSRQMTSKEQVTELLEQVKSLFTQQNINPETMEREGRPAFMICDVADEVNADLIAMGCRGVGLIEEEASDSVSNRVINLSPCPVLVIP